MTKIPTIDRPLIDKLLREAHAAPRRRKNHNFHDTSDHPCHRLVNAMLDDSYIPPHRHLDPAKEELILILRGRLGLVFFDEAGNVTDTTVLEEGGACLAVNIPVGTYHCAVALSEGAVFFEAKAGPYVPHRPEELASFAPREGAPEATAYLARMRGLFADAVSTTAAATAINTATA